MLLKDSKPDRKVRRKNVLETIRVVRKPSAIIITDDTEDRMLRGLSTVSLPDRTEDKSLPDTSPTVDVENCNTTIRQLLEKRKEPLSDGIAAMVATARDKDHSAANILTKQNVGRLMVVFLEDEPEVWEVVEIGGSIRLQRVPVDIEALRVEGLICLDPRLISVEDLLKMFGGNGEVGTAS